MKKVLVKYKSKDYDKPVWGCLIESDEKNDDEIAEDIRSHEWVEKIYEIKSEYVPYYLDIDVIGEITKAEMAEEGNATPIVKALDHLERVICLHSTKSKDNQNNLVICAFSAIAAISGIIGLLLRLLL